MGQLESAKKGEITPEMLRVAYKEKCSPEFIRDSVASGRIVIPANVRHLLGAGGTPCFQVSDVFKAQQLESFKQEGAYSFGGKLWVNLTSEERALLIQDQDFSAGIVAPRALDPIGLGRALSTKINANIGMSPIASGHESEITKLEVAVRFGSDTVMDLSTGANARELRQAIIDNSFVPVGTVPIYSCIMDKSVEEMTVDDILSELTIQAQQGVDYFTIHAGLLRDSLHSASKRQMRIVSRGGAIIAKWMLSHSRQNPFYECFDEICAILKEYDVSISLGDSLRPGCLADATDTAQLSELRILGELVHRARDNDVQVFVEGPGHIPLNEVQANIELERRLCDDAPFYVLGPVVTDVFPGYDHITSAIGASIASYAGASMLCYVTPKEHLGLPDLEDVKQGCIAYKIAAHSGDIAKGLARSLDWDNEMAKARFELNWEKQFELAFDGETARKFKRADGSCDGDYCSMCGKKWCSIRASRELFS